MPAPVPTLEDLPDPAGKRVLVRATLDLPLGADRGGLMARYRAGELADTLDWLADRGAKITVCGDAGGADPEEEASRFAGVRQVLEALLPGVAVADDTAGGGASAEDPEVIEALVGSHDLFVNDSFQWSYLPLPSLVLPPARLASAMGRTVQHDLDAVGPLLTAPERMFVAVLGGNRSYPRLHGLEGLVLRADSLVIGGAMALPFLQAIGKQPADGASQEFLTECRRVYGLAERVQHPVQLPLDLVWLRPDGSVEVAAAGQHPDGQVVDIGPRSQVRFAEMVQGASTLLWSGSLGQVEDPRFGAGTQAVGAALGPGPAVLGGEALVSALDANRQVPASARIITATDPALELLKNGDLPALMALRRSG
ncbi:MAG TPA: phosphoglycerate kinase [Acidimicrobiales bacterium]|nr:phosphoglycerate kinase [Acidimicrobiales bacterium]